MNEYSKAFEELDIDINLVSISAINIVFLKKKYRKQALKYHPDKNGNTLESNIKFQKINEAFQFLKSEFDCDFNEEQEQEQEQDPSFHYIPILQMFLKGVFKNKYTETFLDIVKDIVINLKKTISLSLFDKLDKETAFTIYHFLSKYRDILHINQDILDQIREKILVLYENIIIYKLNPSINDLLNNNMFKLYVDEKLYLVPLWFNESHFFNTKDGDGDLDSENENKKEIIVLCDPELPDNIKIDEENDLHVEITIDFIYLTNLISIQDQPFLPVTVGKKVFEIPLEKLYLKKKQVFRMKQAGLTKANEEDIYDVNNKSDIIFHIIFI
jgi:hypothetical protein